MNVVDIAILVLLLLSAVQGFRTGLIQAFFSLVGLIVGIEIASFEYKRVSELAFTATDWWLRQAFAFCLIVLAVMVVAWLLGLLLKNLITGLGLRWLDRLLGLVFGLLRGALLAGLCIAFLVAVFPDSTWLEESHVPTHFSIVGQWVPTMSAGDLKVKIEDGLRKLEKSSQQLLHSK